MGFLLSKLLPPLLMPLGLALLLQVGGLLGRRRRWGPWLSWGGLALLWLASMPLVSRQLIRGLEEQAARISPAVLPRADVVLVLGGGLSPALPPRRGVEVGEAGDRLLTGVELMRQGKAPWLLLSGGKVSFNADDPAPPEARSAAALAGRLGVPTQRIVLSEAARNTAEEAQALQEMAERRGWRRVLLVTSATHLPRSLATFRRLTDLTIIPVACDFQLPARGSMGRPTLAGALMDLQPSASALAGTSQALRELMGLAAYRLRGWS
jgi:uncharacterized SAM-binding protein YcdF (DUF218 family)